MIFFWEHDLGFHYILVTKDLPAQKLANFLSLNHQTAI
jgi:hypothetical protein